MSSAPFGAFGCAIAFGFAALLVVLAAGCGTSTGTPRYDDPPSTGYAVTASHRLVVFLLEDPATLLADTLLSGLPPGEEIVALDQRYGSAGPLCALGRTSRLFLLDAESGEATAVSPTPFTPSLSGNEFAFCGDLEHRGAHVVSDTGQHLVLDVDTATVTSVGTIDLGAYGAAVLVGLDHDREGGGFLAVDAAQQTLLRLDADFATVVGQNALGLLVPDGASFDLGEGFVHRLPSPGSASAVPPLPLPVLAFSPTAGAPAEVHVVGPDARALGNAAAGEPLVGLAVVGPFGTVE